jgi:tetratricopeptide (TPR) repeat protein
MIGEDGAGVMEIQDANARIPEGGSSLSTTHLFCLKESCRFYRPQENECSFDVAFEQIEAQRRAGAEAGERADDSQKTLDTVKSLLDRVWSFQTQSVTEMIGTMSEGDQKLDDTIERIAVLEKGVVEKIDEISGGVSDDEFKGIRDDLAKLHDAAQSREEGMEELSSTVSEMVMTFEDRLKELANSSATLAERIEKLEASVPTGDDVRKWIADSLGDSDNNAAGVESLAERLDSIVETNSELEETLRRWQEQMDSTVDEMREAQSDWGKNFKELSDELTEKKEAEQMDSQEASAEQEKRARRARKLNNLGVTSFHNGELELARTQFEDAVALDDEFAECYNNLGLVLTELGEEKPATDAFSNAIRINPDLNAAYNNLGYVFYRQGNYDQAIEMYNEALGRCASNSSAYTNLGNAYYQQEKLDEARAAWEKALELDPSNRKASRSLKEMERELAES